MLEEALRNEKHNPAETALAMLAFVQVELPAGGAAAEARFFRLYGPLCERIFGSILSSKEQYKHKDGGWLSATSPWNRSPVSSSRTSSTLRSPVGQQLSVNTSLARGTTDSLEKDPVVRLLGTAGKPPSKDETPPPTFIEAISKETENRPGVGFRLPFHALPKPTQDAWMALLGRSLGGQSADSICSENDVRLFGTLIRKRPVEQNELRIFQQKSAHRQEQRQPLQLSPRGFSSPGFHSPSLSQPSTTKTKDENEESPPNVLLSMLEYYLFVFIRFPLAPPLTYASQPTPMLGMRKKEPYGDSVYFYLFRRYMRHFLPYEREDDRSIALSHSTRDSELFLRIVIALWLESHARITPTSKVTNSIEERRQRAGILEPPTYDLNFSYNLVQAKYDSPPAMVQKCMRSLVVHLALDPAVHDAVVDKRGLSNAMSCIQQPLFDYVRAAFRHASIHAAGSPFFSALDTWLIWLEPWNIIQSKSHHFSAKNATQRIMGSTSSERKPHPRSLSIPKSNSPSKYSPSWEPYIVANLYMYTVPLAIFLRRARELDFSSGKFDRSIQFVKRVFRVFTPEVVDAISRHLEGPSNLDHLLHRHVEILGPYAPPRGSLSLASCQVDMRNLLEDIQMQHLKKVRELDIFERVGARLEGLFGQGVVSGEEKTLENLVDRAKLIVRLPIDYEIISSAARQSVSETKLSADKLVPARTKDGSLSEEGREQIMTGAAKCNPAEISYVGDRMRARVGSHEISFLVKATTWLSDWLNVKLGLIREEKKYDQQGFRINLRFLADYRNLFWIVVFILYKVVW